MRTIRTINELRRDYYEQDESLVKEYYSTNSIHKLSRSQWHGTGAKDLGLSGEIKAEDFSKSLDGFHPKTGERLRGDRTTGKERLAHDVTFSAPKSVSMALHIGGDERIFDAHQDAMNKALDVVESRYAEARRRMGPERVIEKTESLVIGKINHHTSRANEPQMHTHCVVMNCTNRGDRWVSLGHESLSKADWIGHFYQAELERNLNQLGYETYQTRAGFELMGLSREDMEAFSTRSDEIYKYLQKRGMEDTVKNRQKASLETRKKKDTKQSLEQLQTQWKNEAKMAGITIPTPSQHPIPSQAIDANELITSAIAHYSERLVSFRIDDLYRYAYENGGAPTLDALDQAIAQHPELIQYESGEFTTQSALEREVKSIELMQAGQGKFSAYGMRELPESLNAGQRAAIQGVLESSDQVMIWHGKSGVGKTFALGELKASTSIKIRGLSPTRKAAGELAESLEIETDTVQGHLLKPSLNNELWIVDEAGLLDAQQGLELLEKAKISNARILLVGDIRQNQSIGAGSFMKSLIDHGATTWNISKILRQQNDIQHRAVELISQGQGKDALALLDEHGYIQEIDSRTGRAQAITQTYTELPEEERDKTLIVAGTNADREAIAQAIRAELGLGEEHQVNRLIPVGLTKEQARQIKNFQEGDYLRLERKYGTASIERGKLYKVIGKDKGELRLESANGRRYRLNPSKHKEKSVYRAEAIALDVGDKVRWTRNEKSIGLTNGDEAIVTAIDDKNITLSTAKGDRTLPINQPLSLDYGYVSTTYQGQGQTAKRVLVSATNDPTSSIEPFYVATSRQRQELQVFAEDKEKLYQWVQNSNRQANPLELIEQEALQQVKPKRLKKVKSVGISAQPSNSNQSVLLLERPDDKAKQEMTPSEPTQEEFKDSGGPIAKEVDAVDEQNVRPGYILPSHWDELIQGSGINPEIILLNFESIERREILERLLTAKLPTTGHAAQYRTAEVNKVLDYWEHSSVFEGGWWGKAGVNALDMKTDSLWGCLKPDKPRFDKKRDRPIKYEHPAGDRHHFLLHVPDRLAHQIYDKHGFTPDPAKNFWENIRDSKIPIRITEGIKKTAKLLSHGVVVIGVPGINATYQKQPDRTRKLHPELAVFANGRDFEIDFDEDSKIETRRDVLRETVRAAELLNEQGSHITTRHWLWKDGKGVDDLIVAHGFDAFEDAEVKDWSISAERHYTHINRKVAQKVDRFTTPEWRNVGIAYIAIARYGLEDGIKVIAQTDGIKELKWDDKVEAVAQVLDDLEQRLNIQEGELEA